MLPIAGTQWLSFNFIERSRITTQLTNYKALSLTQWKLLILKMKEMNLYLSVYLDVQAYDFVSKRRVAVSMAAMLMELTPFQREYDREHVKLSTTKLRGNEKENKNSRF